MSFNNRMHPRNIYRKSPDYSELALLYPDFMEASRLDLNGKIKLNYGDANVLRTLTKCLLHKDFGLSVVIPHDCLVPTLPLRLNYILWIEDLLEHADCKKIDGVCGIDIGTGACAIYSLLGGVKNKWHMYATENNAVNFNTAQLNVNTNNLQSIITVIKDDGDSLLLHCFNGIVPQQVDFCICNPPFYSSIDDIGRARSPSRPAPRNAPTGSPHELITEGGEVAFISKLITESKILTTKVRLYTTMLGHKTSLKRLIKCLNDNGIDDFTYTEFCQGRTTRWGLAWTFSGLTLKNSATVPKRRNNEKAITFVVPNSSDCNYTTVGIVNKILKILDGIKVQYKHVLRKQNRVVLEIHAHSNSWSNQRRKRRLGQNVKANGFSGSDSQTEQSANDRENPSEEDHKNLSKVVNCHTVTAESNNGDTLPESYESSRKPTFLKGSLVVAQTRNSITLEMKYSGGTAGKDGIHQILQYIKNNWCESVR